MVSTRRRVLYPLYQLREELDRQLENLWDNLPSMPARFADLGAYPRINLWEEEDQLIAEAEVPGVKSDQLHISVLANTLTIKGQRVAETPENTEFVRHERECGEFSRVINLAVEVDPERVKAALSDGILRVTLPKLDVNKARTIEVSTEG